jgi:hypothetical protein
MQTYLPMLRRIEGMSVQEFKLKQKNLQAEAEMKEGESQQDYEERVAGLSIFRPERFLSQKSYLEDHLENMTDPEKLGAFIDEIERGERAVRFASTKPHVEKHSIKMVGSDFE